MEAFREVNFVEQATGRIYLRIESGAPVWMDAAAMRSAISDPDTSSGIMAVAPAALSGGVPDAGTPQYLRGQAGARIAPALGQWGDG
jgi:hypothetical protein